MSRSTDSLLVERKFLEYPPFHTLYSMTIEFWGGIKGNRENGKPRENRKTGRKGGGGEISKEQTRREGGGGGAVRWKWAQRLR